MSITVLSDPQLVEPGNGPWRMYIYGTHDEAGTHDGGVSFSTEPRAGAGDITVAEARSRYEAATREIREVRITNTGDLLVHRAIGRAILHGVTFWSEVLA